MPDDKLELWGEYCEGAVAEVSGEHRNPAWICRETRPETQDISISLLSFIF